jgi:outer membrane receptor protein involved in Fe transport
MKRMTMILIAGACLVQGSGPAHGAESKADEVYGYLLNLSMEQLTEVPFQSSGLFAMTMEQAPGLNHMVSTEQLDEFGIRSLGEYLNRMAPSFATVIHGTQGITVGSRGILIDNSSKTLLLRDNISMNNRHLVGINGADLSSPLLGDIERVEVATGPGALQHGSGAINGFLNMISATGKSKEGVRMRATYGSGDAKVAEASLGKVFSPRANLFLYGGYDQANGVKPLYTVEPADWAGLNGVTGTPSATFLDNVRVGRTDDNYKFSLRGQIGADDAPVQLDLKALLSHSSNVDPVLGEYLGANGVWADEVRLAANARGQRYSPFYEQHSDNVLFSPEIRVHANDHNEVKITPYYQTIKTTSVFSPFLLDEVERLNITLQPKPNPLLAGDCPAMNCAEEYTNYGDELHLGTTMVHTYSGIKDQTIGWGAEAKYFEFGNNDWHWTTVGLFAEDQLVLGAFTLLPGVRYDRTFFSDTIATVPTFSDGPYQAPDAIGALTKRLAISYAIDSQQTAKLSYQEGFRFADGWIPRWGAHVNTQNGTDIQIEPERSDHYEANYSVQDLMDKRLDIITALFYNRYEDTHGYIPAFNNFGNSPEAITSVGGDIIAEYHPTAAWQLGLSYSYARPIDSYETVIHIANQDETWTRYPVHMVKFRLGHEVMKDLFIGTTGVVESPRYEQAGVTDPAIRDLFDQWSWIVDANAWYKIDQHVTLAFTAKELFHKNYNQQPAYYAGARPLDAPRADQAQYYLTLTYAF